jgi:hypothetical protein
LIGRKNYARDIVVDVFKPAFGSEGEDTFQGSHLRLAPTSAQAFPLGEAHPPTPDGRGVRPPPAKREGGARKALSYMGWL